MDWHKIETSEPDPGQQFLAYLSNGWLALLQQPYDERRYDWYMGSTSMSIPVVKTHPPGTLKESIVVTHWTIPEPPEDTA